MLSEDTFSQWKLAVEDATIADWSDALDAVACAASVLNSEHGTDIHIVGGNAVGVRYGGALLPRRTWNADPDLHAGWFATLTRLRREFGLPPIDTAANGAVPHGGYRVVSPRASILSALLIVVREGEELPLGAAPGIRRFCQGMEQQSAHDWSAVFSPSLRVRVSAQRCRTGLAVAVRRLPSTVQPLEALGFHTSTLQRIKDISRAHEGFILCCGAVNSGKSTTITAMIDHGNKHEARKTISNEDPVEQYMPAFGTTAMALTQHREIGEDVPDFLAGIEQALRQDGQCMMVGEIRSKESLDAAMRAVQAGHLVYATLHATGCVHALDRIRLMFAPSEREQGLTILGNNLTALVYQTLVASKGFSLARVAAEAASGGGMISHEDVIAKGQKTSGRRLLAYEYMEGTSGVRKCIRDYAIEGANYRMAAFQEEMQRPPHLSFSKMLSGIRDDLDPFALERISRRYSEATGLII